LYLNRIAGIGEKNSFFDFLIEVGKMVTHFVAINPCPPSRGMSGHSKNYIECAKRVFVFGALESCFHGGNFVSQSLELLRETLEISDEDIVHELTINRKGGHVKGRCDSFQTGYVWVNELSVYVVGGKFIALCELLAQFVRFAHWRKGELQKRRKAVTTMIAALTTPMSPKKVTASPVKL